MTRHSAALLASAVVIAASACAGAKRPELRPAAPIDGGSLWARPADLPQRDLFHGPWGARHGPDGTAVYTLVERKHSGVNPGLTVTDPQGREWSVKQPFPGGLDSEGPVEVVVSRLLSAVGYHQPPVYFLPAFTLKDDWGTHVETGGRFRLKEATLKDLGSWPWEANPFVGTKPYQGLLVLLMMLNSTDLKNSNNSLYEHRRGDLVERWYVVRDVGAALGDTNRITPRKNHVDSFERHPFIIGVNGDHVGFAYKSWYKNLVQDRITPEDVTWASQLLGQLSTRQWNDAFRAAGYQPDEASRFIRKLREKIEEGRSLTRRAARE